MKTLIKYQPDYDQLSAEENHDLQKALKSVEKFVQSSAKISEVDYATRDAHAKTYATVKGSLEISEGLPGFITDIFSERHYELLARFSNGNLVIIKKGLEIPLYGFSIKIKNIKGQDANFPLVNFPLFPTNSPSKFLKLFTSVNTFLVTKEDNFLVSALDLPLLFKNSLSLFGAMLSVDFIKKISQFVPKMKDFFFSFNYDGIGCYRMGDYIMKIGLKPVRNVKNIDKKLSQKEALNDFISQEDSHFLLMVQFSENPEKQPVNDLMKMWKEAPEYCLGKITIPKASQINSADLEIENLNFNPFENHEFLQPVGKIQQIRKKIYEVSIGTRNRLNGQ